MRTIQELLLGLGLVISEHLGVDEQLGIVLANIVATITVCLGIDCITGVAAAILDVLMVK